jgi:predicted phage gp36 major capsid-like protein
MPLSENEILRMYDELQKDQNQLLLDLKNIKEDDDSHKVEANIQKQISSITQLLCSLLKLKKLKKIKMSL